MFPQFLSSCRRKLPVLRRRTDKVPFVAGDVEKHSDAAVGFGTRCREELHASGCHPCVRGIEVLNVEEETDPAGGLLPDDGGLVFPVSPREQQAGRGTGRPDYYPPLGPPVVRQGRGVLHEIEAQYVNEETDSRIVLADHDGDKAEMHGASIGDPLFPAPRRHPASVAMDTRHTPSGTMSMWSRADQPGRW